MKEIIKGAVKGNYVLLALTIIAMGLIITSFFMPPAGAIDRSVVTAVGEVFAFSALWAFVAAVREGVNAKVTHNGTTLSVSKDDEGYKEDGEYGEDERYGGYGRYGINEEYDKFDGNDEEKEDRQ